MLDRERLLVLYRGNADAVALAVLLAELAETWDDLVDGDKPRAPAEISRAFLVALNELPRNAFYRANAAELQPLILDAVLAWSVANRLQLDADRDALEIAHVLRYQGAQLLAHIALIVTGDMIAATEAGAEIWRMTSKEGFAAFAREQGLRVVA